MLKKHYCRETFYEILVNFGDNLSSNSEKNCEYGKLFFFLLLQAIIWKHFSFRVTHLYMSWERKGNEPY